MAEVGFINNLLNDFNLSVFPRLILPFLTLVGAWGGFPEPPRMFKKIVEYRFFQYFFLWVLVMQGGASVDPGLSLVSVIVFVSISEVIKMLEGEETVVDDIKKVT